MSFVPPRSRSSSPPPREPDGKGNTLHADVKSALACKDVGDLNLVLFRVVRDARAKPEGLRQVFGQLHLALAESARHGTPMLHKERVAEFLAEQGLARLRLLTKTLLEGTDTERMHANIAEARSLLADGYGGKETAKLTHQVGLREFDGRAPNADAREPANRRRDKAGGGGLAGALNAARRGVSMARQHTAKTLRAVAKKGKGTGGDEPDA